MGNPVIPANIQDANAKANAILKKKTIVTPLKDTEKQPAPLVGSKVKGIEPVVIGSSTNWNMFLDNSFAPITVGPNGTKVQPYISGELPTSSNPNPGQIAILPNADGQGFYTDSVDSVAAQAMINVSAGNIKAYKTKLRLYYPSTKDFKLSLATTDKDIAFQTAVTNAINEISVANFGFGVTNAKAKAANPNAPLPVPLYNFDTYVLNRPDVAQPTSGTSRTSQLTTEVDAKNEFNRTVQQYIGNPDLVDKVDVLREAYWTKLHTEEMLRFSSSTTTTDIVGDSLSKGFSWAPLSEQDRTDMRLNFIINGGSTIDPKTKEKLVSVGIKNTTQQQLEDEGGLVGAAYGKLKTVAADYGIELTHADLLARVYKVLKPGGNVAGISSSSMDVGLEQETNSIKQAAKVHFKGLAPYIDSGLKVSDIASNFQRLKENEMGLVQGAVSIYDEDVQKAVGGPEISSKNDFLLGVRSKPAWRFSPKANETAATFLETINKAWGKIG